MIRRTAAAAMILVGFTMAGVAAPSPASATTVEVQYGAFGGPQYNCPPVINDYVTGCFVPSTGNFFAADTWRDSQRVAVFWWVGNGSGRQGLCIHKYGTDRNGTGEFVGCDNAFAEGAWVHFKAGRCDGSVSACNRPWQYNTWTAERVFQAT